MGTIATKPQTERKPGPMPAGRICAEPDCSTPLSRYNEGDTCAPCRGGTWLHQPMTPFQHRNAFADLMAEVA